MPKTIEKNETTPFKSGKRKGNPRARYIHDRWDFDSFDELLDVMQIPLTDEQIKAWTGRSDGVPSSQQPERSRPFFGSESFEAALKLAREGWAEGRAEFADRLDALHPYVEAAAVQPSVELAPAGYAPDIAAYCAGSPACMYTETDWQGSISSRTRVIRVLVNIATHAGTPTEYMKNRGAALCAVIEYFETLGIRVEVELCHVAKSDSRGRDGVQTKVLHEHYIPVKRADEQIEPDRFAFMLGHASVLRRFIFKLDEMNAAAGPHMPNYGWAADAEPDPDQVYFNAELTRRGNDFTSPEAGLRTVVKRLQEALAAEDAIRVGEDWAEVLGTDRAAL